MRHVMFLCAFALCIFSVAPPAAALDCPRYTGGESLVLIAPDGHELQLRWSAASDGWELVDGNLVEAFEVPDTMPGSPAFGRAVQ